SRGSRERAGRAGRAAGGRTAARRSHASAGLEGGRRDGRARRGQRQVMSGPDDLDALVTELNAGAPQARRAGEETARLRSWLAQVVERSASDLLLVPGAP